ncbi:MAG: hypothetical protein ABIZ52_04315 [Candidatus Limnocylindrales bacterium]
MSIEPGLAVACTVLTPRTTSYDDQSLCDRRISTPQGLIDAHLPELAPNESAISTRMWLNHAGLIDFIESVERAAASR